MITPFLLAFPQLQLFNPCFFFLNKTDSHVLFLFFCSCSPCYCFFEYHAANFPFFHVISLSIHFTFSTEIPHSHYLPSIHPSYPQLQFTCPTILFLQVFCFQTAASFFFPSIPRSLKVLEIVSMYLPVPLCSLSMSMQFPSNLNSESGLVDVIDQ